MRVDDIKADIAYYLGFNEGQTNQDFTDKRLLWLLNKAYRKEWSEAQVNGRKEWFKQNYPLTWASSTTTLALPDSINKHSILTIWDETTGIPGSRLEVAESQLYGLIFWRNNKTLQYGHEGPPCDLSLVFDYVPEAERLQDDADEPQLIPPKFHDMLAISAACIARMIADEAAPASWIKELGDQRLNYYAFLQTTRPVEGIIATVNEAETRRLQT